MDIILLHRLYSWHTGQSCLVFGAPLVISYVTMTLHIATCTIYLKFTVIEKRMCDMRVKWA